MLHDQTIPQNHHPGESAATSTIDDISRASRRRLLAMLAVLPAAIGSALLLSEPAGAKKRKNTRRKRRKKKRKNRKGKGGGGGGDGYSPDAEERAFLERINAYREQRGVRKLSLNAKLGAAAKFHSRDMAKKNYFKHKLSNGDSPEQNIRRFGYTNYSVVGENIAAGHEAAKDVFAAWKSSSGHNRNMLDPDFTEIGIGRAHKKKSKYGWYWTTTFGG